MTNQDFTTTLVVSQNPQEAFNAISNPRAWWSEEITGGTANLNDVFDYHYEDVHICKMKLTEIIPNQKVVWLVLENYFKFTEDKTEWVGNTISFEISEKDNQTQIIFTQCGLTPAYECYNICNGAWTNYIHKSLASLIATGKGMPNAKGKPQTADEEKLTIKETNINDYQKSITVNNPASEVYTAITQHIPDWWSDDFYGASAQKGEQYNIAFGETRKTFEIEETIPNEKVVWLCLKAHINMDTLKKKDEWVGTRLIWTITTGDAGTILMFVHQGLNNSFECYDVCVPAWDYFIASIQAFLTTGKGTPYQKKEAKLDWEG